MALLGVNIDHVATVRQARLGLEPDPVEAALICEQAGVDSIVAHLREDRRHIQDDDVMRLKKALNVRFNLEMSIAPEIVDIACRVRPAQVTLVPEKRQELTTEGGLDVVRHKKKLRPLCERLEQAGIEVSLFIDPDQDQVDATLAIGVTIIELHTGCYADAKTKASKSRELKTIERMTAYGQQIGLVVNAGHGLKYHDTRSIAEIPGMNELNIGHSIMSRAMMVGMEQAAKDMIRLVKC